MIERFANAQVEGGCYAKCVGLAETTEPEIYRAIRFGSVVENVIIDEALRAVDFDDISLTENTRCAYPLEFIPNAKLPAIGSHPNHVILLTCDGYGVLPPVSRLSKAQVVYHFIQGYTSKMAGTEEGVTKPVAAFSACYGEPFLVWHPVRRGCSITSLLRRCPMHSPLAAHRRRRPRILRFLASPASPLAARISCASSVKARGCGRHAHPVG